MITTQDTFQLQQLIAMYVNNAVKSLADCCKCKGFILHTEDTDTIALLGKGTIANPLKANLLVGTGSGYNDEDAQDAVGVIGLDTLTVDFTYNDGVPSFTWDVKVGAVDNTQTDLVVWTGTELKRRTVASLGIGATDELIKISANDTTAGYLNGKLVQAAGILLTEVNDGGNETFTVAHADTSSVSDLDTSGAQVIDTLTFDTFGHVQTVTTRDLTPSDIGITTGNFWNILGNAGTVAGTNFIGTTDNISFQVKVNALLAGQIDVDQFNTSWGQEALLNRTAGGLNNVAIGYRALWKSLQADDNVAIGNEALTQVTSSSRNVAVGKLTLSILTNGGSDNVAVGYQSQINNTAGQNTSLGSGSLKENTAIGNVAVGYLAMRDNTTGLQNTAIGYEALKSNTTSSFNTAIGRRALTFLISGDGKNTAVGTDALESTLSIFNTAVGHYAMKANTTGSINTAVGGNALMANTTGEKNTSIGAGTMEVNTIGTHNTAVGYDALLGNIDGHWNVGVGWNALSSNQSGSLNAAMGNRAGASINGGSYNIFIGSDAGFNALQKVDAADSIAIGKLSYTTADNQIVIGSTEYTDLRIPSHPSTRNDATGITKAYYPINTDGDVGIGTITAGGIGAEVPLTFNSGLTRTVNNVRWNGILLQDAIIPTGAFSIILGGDSNYGLSLEAGGLSYLGDFNGAGNGSVIAVDDFLEEIHITTDDIHLTGQNIFVTTLPNDNTEVNLVTWNSTTKNLEYRTVASLSIPTDTHFGNTDLTQTANRIYAGGGFNYTLNNLGNWTFNTAAAKSFSVFAGSQVYLDAFSATTEGYIDIDQSSGVYLHYEDVTGASEISIRGSLGIDLIPYNGLLYIDSLANDNTETNLLTYNTVDDRVEYRTVASLPFEAPLTFNNGLTRTVNTVQLGGSFIQDTTIDLAGFEFGIFNGVNAHFGITPGDVYAFGDIDIVGNGTRLEMNDTAQTIELVTGANNTGFILDGSAETIKFVEGSLAAASNGYVWTLADDATGEGTWAVASGGQASIQFQDEGVNEGTSGGVTVVDFVGAGVTANEAAGTLTVTISGGAGGYTVHTIDDTDSPYTVTETSGTIIILIDATTADVDVILPTAVGNTAEYRFKRINSSANDVTITPDGVETIDGNADETILFENTSFTIISDNANWWRTS